MMIKNWIRIFILFLFLAYTISNIQLMFVPATAQTEPVLLLTRYHYGVKWEFYDGGVKVYGTNEELTIAFVAMNETLDQYKGLQFQYNDTHVVYFYNTSVTLGNFTLVVNVTCIFVFSQDSPQVKLKTIVETDKPVPDNFTDHFVYWIVYKPTVLGLTGTFNANENELVGAGKIYFDWRDMNVSNIKYVYKYSVQTDSVGLTLQELKLIVNMTNMTHVTVDPIIGYKYGTRTFTEFHINNANTLLYYPNTTNTTTLALYNGLLWMNQTFKIKTPVFIENITVYAYGTNNDGKARLIITDVTSNKIIYDKIKNTTGSTAATGITFTVNKILFPGNYTFRFEINDSGNSNIKLADSKSYVDSGALNGNITLIDYKGYYNDGFNVLVMKWYGDLFVFKKVNATYITSDANVTYIVHIEPAYSIPYNVLYDKNIYTVINVTRNDGLQVPYNTLTYNASYDYINFTASTLYNYSVYLVSSNVIQVTLPSIVKSNTTLRIVGKITDPYGFPLANKTVNYTVLTDILPDLSNMKILLTQIVDCRANMSLVFNNNTSRKIIEKPNDNNDSLVHFKNFPPGDWLIFQDLSSGRIIHVARIPSNDFVVDIPFDKYAVSLLEPVGFDTGEIAPTINGLFLHLSPNSSIVFINSTTVNVVENTNNDSLVYIEGFPVGTRIEIYDAWDMENILNITVVGNDPIPIYLPAGNYVLKIHPVVCNQTMIITTKMLGPNKLVVPHLYDMLFNNTYSRIYGVVFDKLPIEINITLMLYNSGLYQKIVYTPGALNFIFLPNYTFRLADDRGNYIQGSTQQLSNNLLYKKWERIYTYVMDVNFTNASILINGTNITTAKYGTWSGSALGGSFVGYIYGHLYAKVKYIFIRMNGTEYLFDPIFQNDTCILDAFNSSICIPKENVSIIESRKKWLWVLDNIVSDNLTHFRFFPNGTIIEIYDLSGNLVKRFFVTSSDIAVNISAGTYRVVVYFPWNYSTGNITSDNTGSFSFNITLPPNNSISWIILEYDDGVYAGYFSAPVYTTRLHLTLVPPPRFIDRKERFCYGVFAWLPIGGEIDYVYINGTKYNKYVFNQSIAINLSGWYNFTINASASKSQLVANKTFIYRIFVGGAIVWNVTKNPQQAYFTRETNITYTVDAHYQNGVHIDENSTALIYINGSLVYNGSLPFTMNIFLKGDTVITVNLTDIDNKKYHYSEILYINYLYVSMNISGYLTDLQVNVSVRAKTGIVGEHVWALYFLQNQTNKTYDYDVYVTGSNNSLILDRLVIDDNYDNFFLVRLKIINPKTTTRTLNITVKLADAFGNIYASASRIGVTAIAYGIIELQFNLTRNIVYDIPYYIDVDVKADDGENLTYMLIAPLTRTKYRVRHIVLLNNTSTFGSVKIDLSKYINKTLPVYAYVACENALGVVIDPESQVIKEVNVPFSPSTTQVTTTTVGITTTFNPGDPAYKPNFPPLAFPVDNSLGGMLGVMFVIAIVIATSRLEIRFPRALLLAGSILTILGIVLSNLGLMGVGIVSIAIAIGLMFI